MGTNRKIVVIVTSVIYFKEKRLSYSKNRSKFSIEERISQTEKTISSIREKIPNAEIILVEAGLKKDVGPLSSKVDKYVYIGDKFLVRLGVDSIFKGIGEAIILLSVSKYLPGADFYFKISGRYYLDNDFDLNKWDNNYFTVRKYDNVFSTRLYGFGAQFLNIWKKSLMFSIPLLLSGQSIERIMPMFINKKYIKHLNKIGISGLGSAYGDPQKD